MTLRILLTAAAFSVLASSAPGQTPASDSVDGVWHGDDGGLYYIRQIGNRVWWLGLSTESAGGYLDFFKGIRFTNLFRGTIDAGRIRGDWVEVPTGGALGDGTLVLDVVPGPPMGLRLVGETGGFAGKNWSRSATATPPAECSSRPGIRCAYDHVRKNDGSALSDNLKPEKDHVAIFGSVRRGLRLGGDRDLTFKFTVDRARLDGVPGFWTEGWEYADGPSVVQRKLNANNNVIEGEIIMYGRSDAAHPPLLPGWAESDANSALWNGRPLNGSPRGDSSPANVGGASLARKQRVRVRGVLNLDCGHFPYDCDDPTGLAEIHPVYAVDVVQDWTRRAANADLTGTWAGDDMSTYYLRQIGNKVWWLNLSRDQGRSFANVFVGTVGTETILGSQRPVVGGDWVDVPLGGTSRSGTLKVVGALCVAGSCSPNKPVARYNDLRIRSGTGGFGGRGLEKLYDRTAPPPGPP